MVVLKRLAINNLIEYETAGELDNAKRQKNGCDINPKSVSLKAAYWRTFQISSSITVHSGFSCESPSSFLAVKKIIRTLAPYILVKNFSAK
jgi:hypothetical protein